MKRTGWILLAALMVASCGMRKNSEETRASLTGEAEQLVGGEKDEHGCLPSAGETWSELRGECLQLFNVGKRLNPLEVKEGEAVISAFVVFDDAYTKAEVFFPSGRENIILDKTADGVFQKENCRYDDVRGVLSIDGKDVYKVEETALETLIIFYDAEVGNEPLMKAVEAYGAKLVYSYEQLKGIAVSVPQETVEEAERYFKQVKGVLGVNKNETNQLHAE